MKRVVLQSFALLFCLFFVKNIYAQNTLKVGFMPEMNFKTNLQKNWTTSFKFQPRYVFMDKPVGENMADSGRYERTAMTFFLIKSFKSNQQIGGGLFYTFNNNKNNVLRFLQKYTIAHSLGELKLQHNIQAEEFVEKDSPMTFRLRYKWNTKFDWETKSVRPLHLKLSNEHIWINQKSFNDYEIRIGALMGTTMKNTGLDIGLDTRVNKFVHQQTKFTIYGMLIWTYKL